MISHRKGLVNAFTKIANRWEDSKKTPHSLRRYGYRNSRQWGRMMADQYFDTNGLIISSTLIDAIDDANKVDMPMTQIDYDCVAEEEISCW